MKKTMMLTLAMGAIMSAQVMAADNRVNVSGSYCTAAAGSDAAKVDKTYGGVVNTSANTITVGCPVIMDEVINTGGTNHIYYNVSAATTCFFASVNGDGTNRALSIGSGGPGWVSMPNITTDDAWGSYVLGCNLPAGATLRTVSVSEKP